ncbi:hypothetical protein WA026_003190 [Henosepilachna vigintioctopunctata]|uniref:Alpha-methylacyl-CoA racemase n=1 Tax=Henosepilachna vigintioctopunctata TaxID=420089 RepID=A0AAW1TNV4_9CUCU
MALKGLKVLEIAGLVPAPFCGKILSDFGASILRVDKIGFNTEFDCLSDGKQSIALNMKSPQGVEILRKICQSSDILIEPFRKGVMEALGLGPDILMNDNPRLIYARLSGYGQSGAYSSKAGHDINFIALSGLLSTLGRKNQKPTFPINLIADFGGGGLMCALGILLALFEREKSGLGQVVDNSMVNGSAYLGSWLYTSRHLPIWGKERGDNMLDSGSHFYDVYETKDGKFISVGSVEFQFYEALLQGLGLTHDDAPQIDTTGEVKKLFTQKFKEKTLDEWLAIFSTLDACVAPVLSLDEAPLHPHNVDQNTFFQHDGRFYPTPAPKLSRTPGIQDKRQQPHRGQHTKIILKELDYSDELISQLEEMGVIELYRPSKL